ncbi:MAG: glutaredoxin 3 [Patescibacteria group bacterium]|nr:glutaredoxin 3 [Patescibacteria group bacterium]
MKVTVYSTPACPWCHLAKEFLTEHQIPFEEVDVSQDEAKAQEMILKSGQMGVPVIEIDGQIVIGFNKPRLEELLGLNHEGS